jgi:hypothetical protein
MEMDTILDGWCNVESMLTGSIMTERMNDCEVRAGHFIFMTYGLKRTL